MNIATDLRNYRRNILQSQAVQAGAVATLALDYAQALIRDDGRLLDATDFAEFRLINAICELINDGEIIAQREHLMDQLRIDEDGNAVDEDGFAVRVGAL